MGYTIPVEDVGIEEVADLGLARLRWMALVVRKLCLASSLATICAEGPTVEKFVACVGILAVAFVRSVDSSVVKECLLRIPLDRLTFQCGVSVASSDDDLELASSLTLFEAASGFAGRPQ